MEKRKLDKLGIETSLLGFGCMRFPTNEEGKIDEKRAEEMLDKAIAEGVNYIDTAYPYHDGESEPFVGKVLKKYDRGSFYLATKMPVWLIKNTEDAERIFKSQLERLQTDYIDFYLLHAMNAERWQEMQNAGIVEYCEKLKEQGKIKYLGFSFHDSYESFEKIATARDWDFCQIQLNYMDTEEQAGLRGYELTEKRNLPLIIMEPVKGGSLAGFSKDIDERFHKMDAQASIASYALRWVGSLKNVRVILSGMSNMEQLEDNLATFKNFQPLSEAEGKEIEDIVAALKGRIQNGCTGCRYCMPCPAGVDIPRNFKIWNHYHIYGNYNSVKWEWENDMPESAKAKNCIKCGKCEKECPQKISIREDLERSQKELDEKALI